MKMKSAKLIGAFIGVTLFVLITASITYAFLLWRSDETEITATPECFTIDYTRSQDITSSDLKLFDLKEIFKDASDETSSKTMTIQKGMAVTYASATLKNECNIEAELSLSLNVTSLDEAYMESGDSNGALNYALLEYHGETKPVTDSENLVDIEESNLNNQSFKVIKNAGITTMGEQEIYTEQLPKGEKKEYLVVFYVDGDKSENKSQDATFNASIKMEANQIES